MFQVGFMVFHGSRSVFMVFHVSRLVFHGSRLVFMAFHGFRGCVSWFLVGFHGFFVVPGCFFRSFWLVFMVFKVVSWYIMVFGWFP